MVWCIASPCMIARVAVHILPCLFAHNVWEESWKISSHARRTGVYSDRDGRASFGIGIRSWVLLNRWIAEDSHCGNVPWADLFQKNDVVRYCWEFGGEKASSHNKCNIGTQHLHRTFSLFSLLRARSNKIYRMIITVIFSKVLDQG